MDNSIVRRVAEQACREAVDSVAAVGEDLVRAVLGRGAVKESEEQLRGAFLGAMSGFLRGLLDALEPELRDGLRAGGHRDRSGRRCDGLLESKGFKQTTLLTLGGELQGRQWTARCQKCGQRIGAWDELLDVLNGMTAAAASVVTQMAVIVPYEQAESRVREAAGLEVDDHRIQRTVAALAPRGRAQMNELPASRRALPPKETRIYILLDGGRVRLRGPGSPWREPCVGLVTWAGRDGKLVQYGISHPTQKQPVLSALDRWMKRFSAGGWEVVIISDGAEWIHSWAAQYPGAIRILDYYHVREHVWDAAKVLYGEGTPRAARWVEQIMDRLWRGWSPSTVTLLGRMKPQGERASEKRAALDRLATYLQNHRGLIFYGEDRNCGRWIGSGAIESLCKQLFTMRLKGPGMFWTEEGAGHILALRTLYVTGRWDQMFERRLAA
jgi:hypothetical protein